MAEEADLRGLLTKHGVAAHIVLEVKPDRVVTNLSLLRKDDAGKISLADIRFSELMHLSLTWAVAKPGEINCELVRRQVYGFMQMAEALSRCGQGKLTFLVLSVGSRFIPYPY